MFALVAEKETIRDLLLEAKDRRGMKYAVIAKRIPTDKQNITNFMRGITKNPSFLDDPNKFAEAIRLPVDRVEAAIQNTFAADDDSEPGTDGNINPLHDIPQWDLEIAAGDWCESCVNGQIDTNDAAQVRSMEQGLFRVRIRGDSMLPKFKEGEILEFKIFRHGEAGDEGIKVGNPYYVHRSDGTCTFKILESMDDETVVLRPLNRKKYPKALTVPAQEIVRMARFVGKFVPDEG